MGKIKGVTLGVGGRLKGVSITIEGEGVKRELISDEQGSYEVELPPGLYRINAAAPDYFPFQRAAFQVSPNAVTEINIVPVLRILGVALVMTSSGAKDVPRIALSPKYASFSTSRASKTPLDLLIQYRERIKHQSNIEYNKAVISYDAITIYADKAYLDKDNLRIIASGNDIVTENNGQRIRVRRAELYIKAGRPILNLIKGAISAASGEGVIEKGDITFSFNAIRDSLNNSNSDGSRPLIYKDNKSGIELVSSWYSVKVIDEANNIIVLNGNGIITGRDILPFTIDGRRMPAEFTVTLQDIDTSDGGKGLFSISIKSLNNYQRSGPLSSGNIEIHRNQ